MHFTRRRQCVPFGLSRWLLSWGLAALVLPALAADGQHEAAVEAMGPPSVAGPVLTNPIIVSDIAHLVKAPAAKDRIRTARLLPPPTSPAATTGGPPPPTAETPATTPAGPGTTGPPVTRVVPPEAVVGRPSGPGNVVQPAPAPQQKPPLADPEQVQITADALDYREGATTARGNVELRYQDLTVTSETADLDKERVWGGFQGDVNLLAPLYSARASRLRINIETEDFSAQDSHTTVDPKFFEGAVAAPIYLHAGEVVGRPGRVVGTQVAGTSCDVWPDPHWMLRSPRITVVPDNSVTFHRPALYLWGHHLLTYPWDLRLSLVRRENRFLPEVGQNEVEGYYAKFAYGYALSDENSGFLRLHLTQKRGVGFGFDHILDASRQWAELSVFAEPERGSLTGQLMHRGQYAEPLSSTLSVSFQQNTGFGITSNALSGDLSFRYDTRDIQSQLGLQESIISSGVSTSRRFTSNMNYRQRLGSRGSWDVRSTYYNSSFQAGVAADEELDTEFNWRQEFDAFTSRFVAQKRFDVDGSRYTGDSNFFRLDRLPDWTLNTDSDRLGDFRLLGRPLEATVYLGNYVQHPDEFTAYRTGADLRLSSIETNIGERIRLNNSLRFRQMLYTDAGQWLADWRSEVRVILPAHWETRLSYSYSTLEGFTPFRMDFASPVNSAYFQAACFVPDRLRINMTFGRDFQNSYYQDAILRAEILLTPRNRVELQGGYSIESSRWRPINLRWVFATRRAWWSALTINYDLDQSDLTNVRLDLDWTPLPAWRLQFLGGYSSFTGLNQADVRLSRDLHCMIAQLTYVYATSEIRVGLGIKAFPSATRTFGVGRQGQYFESNFYDQY
jgi:hypothetical protein